MNTNATLEQMKELKLPGMALAYAQQLELPVHQQLEAHELIAQLLQSEQLTRQQEKTAYYLKLAKLRLTAIPEQIHCSPSRNLTKQQLATLLEGYYLKHGENVLITGATGCGKSYLACARIPGLPNGNENNLLQYEQIYRKNYTLQTRWHLSEIT